MMIVMFTEISSQSKQNRSSIWKIHDASLSSKSFPCNIVSISFPFTTWKIQCPRLFVPMPFQGHLGSNCDDWSDYFDDKWFNFVKVESHPFISSMNSDGIPVSLRVKIWTQMSIGMVYSSFTLDCWKFSRNYHQDWMLFTPNWITSNDSLIEMISNNDSKGFPCWV